MYIYGIIYRLSYPSIHPSHTSRWWAPGTWIRIRSKSFVNLVRSSCAEDVALMLATNMSRNTVTRSTHSALARRYGRYMQIWVVQMPCAVHLQMNGSRRDWQDESDWIWWIKRTQKHRYSIIYRGFVRTSTLLPVIDVPSLCLDHGHKSRVQCCIPYPSLDYCASSCMEEVD